MTGFLLPLLALVLDASAAVLPEYTPKRLRDVQSEGRTAVVAVHSPTCDLCKKQVEILYGMSRKGDKTTPVVFQADFDAQAAFRKLYDVRSPSTILIFRSNRLLGRKSGLYNQHEIRDLIHKSVMRSRAKPRPRPKRKYRPKR